MTGQAAGIDVLLVEDNEGDALLVREALEELQDVRGVVCRPHRVDSLRAALAWIDDQPLPDCVLLDLGLPDAVAEQALDAILHRAPWLPVVVLTVEDDHRRISRALARGAQDWLVKTAWPSPDQLGRTLHHAVQRGRAHAEVGRSRDELARFAHTVAHDLKGPITVMSGYAEFIDHLLEQAEVDEARSLLSRMLNASRRLAEYTDGLLAYAQAPVHDTFVPVDLAAVANWVEALLAPTLSAAGASLEVAAGLPSVRGHEAGLQQVLLNLVGNAVKYRDPSRDLRVEITARCETEGLVEVVEVVVRDNGTGIRPQDRDRVFEPGARGASPSPGLGLGLAVVRQVVESHRGRIWVGDADGGGTDVHFTLPRA